MKSNSGSVSFKKKLSIVTRDTKDKTNEFGFPQGTPASQTNGFFTQRHSTVGNIEGEKKTVEFFGPNMSPRKSVSRIINNSKVKLHNSPNAKAKTDRQGSQSQHSHQNYHFPNGLLLIGNQNHDTPNKSKSEKSLSFKKENHTHLPQLPQKQRENSEPKITEISSILSKKGYQIEDLKSNITHLVAKIRDAISILKSQKEDLDSDQSREVDRRIMAYEGVIMKYNYQLESQNKQEIRQQQQSVEQNIIKAQPRPSQPKSRNESYRKSPRDKCDVKLDLKKLGSLDNSSGSNQLRSTNPTISGVSPYDRSRSKQSLSGHHDYGSNTSKDEPSKGSQFSPRKGQQGGTQMILEKKESRIKILESIYNPDLFLKKKPKSQVRLKLMNNSSSKPNLQAPVSARNTASSVFLKSQYQDYLAGFSSSRLQSCTSQDELQICNTEPLRCPSKASNYEEGSVLSDANESLSKLLLKMDRVFEGYQKNGEHLMKKTMMLKQKLKQIGLQQQHFE